MPNKLIRLFFLSALLAPLPALAGGTFFWPCESTTAEFSAGDTTATANGDISISASSPLKGSNSCLTTDASDYYIFDDDGIVSEAEGGFGLLVRFGTAIPSSSIVGIPMLALDTADNDRLGFSSNVDEVRGVLQQQGSSAINLGTSSVNLAVDTTYFYTWQWDVNGDRRRVAVYNGATCALIQENVDTVTDLSTDLPGEFNALRIGNSTSHANPLRVDTVVVTGDYDDPIADACPWTSFFPTFSAALAAGSHANTSLEVTYTPDQPGTGHVVACPNGQTATHAQILAQNCSGGAAAAYFSEPGVAGVGETKQLTGLTPSTTYDVFGTYVNSLGGAKASVSSLPDQATTGGSVTFTNGPNHTGITNGYNIAGTITGSGTLTVESVGVNPGAPTPTCTQVKAGQDGNGTAAPLNNSEVWVTGVANDFNLTLAGAWAAHDVHTCGTNGTTDTSVSSSFSLKRAEDTGQGIVELTSVSPTSQFAVQSVANCDTSSGSATVTGCGDTSWLQAGMLVDLSAGFADLTDIIVEAVTADSITFEITANATTANITVTQNPFYSPAVAAGDFVEGNDVNSAGEAVTLSADGNLSFTPVAQTYRTWNYNVQDASDPSDGDFDSGPPAWTAGDDVLHFFSVRPELDSELGSAPFLFYVGAALSGVNLSCSDDDGQTTSLTSRSSPPAGTSIATSGAWTGTPAAQNEAGSLLTLDCVDSGLLYATPVVIEVFVTDDVITAPNCVGDTVTECLVELDAVRGWLDANTQLQATFQYDGAVAAGDIISQLPAAAGSLAAEDDPLNVVVSLGPAPTGGVGGRQPKIGIGIP